jgi:hypothetical protein
MSGCWLWKGAPDKDGYGRIGIKKKTFKAHRVSYALHNGDHGDLMVMHKCDTPPCVNPDHLFIGTAKDNSDDMKKKGRSRPGGRAMKGEANGRAVLSARYVRRLLIRHREGKVPSGAAEARRVGVHHTTIQNILSGKKWGHLRCLS